MKSWLIYKASRLQDGGNYSREVQTGAGGDTNLDTNGDRNAGDTNGGDNERNTYLPETDRSDQLNRPALHNPNYLVNVMITYLSYKTCVFIIVRGNQCGNTVGILPLVCEHSSASNSCVVMQIVCVQDGAV